MALWPTIGGAAVAQPGPRASKLERMASVCYALVTLGLACWAGSEVRAACGDALGAPLDDSYIHFQFARSFAQFRPFEYTPGSQPVPGATSLLWPGLLTPALWLGASAHGLIGLTWVLGFASLFGQAREVMLAGRRFLDWPFALCAGLLVLALSANTWFAGSAMEVVPLGFLLLRSARRGAEYAEGARSRGRALELFGLAAAAVLLRPEGALAAVVVAAAFAVAGRDAPRERPFAAAALVLPLLTPLIDLLFTGSATQTTTVAKWLPMNPYYSGRLLETVAGNLQLLAGTLLDGREWAWTFIPEGYNWIALGCLPALAWAAARRGARVHAALLAAIGLGLLIPTTYETFLVNRLRYLWPFSAPWLLGLAALGQLVSLSVGRFLPRAALVGLALPLAGAWGLARLAPISVADLATSAAAISAQQVSLGKWAAQALPRQARIGVNDAGAIAFYSGRPTFDLVGLTTQGEARHWSAGVGSRFEHYERLPASVLPTHFIVYPDWFALSRLFGPCLTERRVEGATILGGPLMVACRADYSSLGSGARPTLDLGRRALVDELDVADLESEAEHGYVLGRSSAQLNVLVSLGGIADGGRAERTLEQFRLAFRDHGLLVLRLSASPTSQLQVTIAGKPALSLVTSPHELQELTFEVPAGIPAGPQPVTLRSDVPVTVLHYWSYGPR